MSKMFISAFTSVKLTFNATVKRRLRAVSQAFYCAERLPSILHDAQAPALGTLVGNKLFHSHYTVGEAVNAFVKLPLPMSFALHNLLLWLSA